ncbi:MAG TPA: DNA topoisomerase I [Patescibacteria group bacterium]|nr:DNA topoisomerase I [Patescibacteria group bacterium]
MAGRILVISEKPSAARRLAQALDEGNTPLARREGKVIYYVARREGNELVVVSALGHLYGIAQKGGRWTYPVFETRWVPSYMADKRQQRSREYIKVIEHLSGGATGFVSACDFDTEGSLIAYMILLNVCGEGSVEKARRMRYSTLTDEELLSSWSRMGDLDHRVIEAGKARHEVDWLYGINLTRALTLSIRSVDRTRQVLSIGRIQGPTLVFIDERERQIDSFNAQPYWVIEAGTEINGEKLKLQYAKSRIETREEAENIVEGCRGKGGVIHGVRVDERVISPPPPFNLGSLQREAYKMFRLSPRKTLNAAEKLYLGAFISYPRTSSERLPPSVDLRAILQGLRRNNDYREAASRLLNLPDLKPKDGRGRDPAHPAIHPTGERPRKLSMVERRVYDLICRRFMACLSGESVRSNTVADVDIGGHLFHLRGSQILEKGWIEHYGPYYRGKEVAIPELEAGRKATISSMDVRRVMTSPPPRFNAASLLKKMEVARIGTKATRTDIIDTLHRRGYVRGETFEITELGKAIIGTLGRYVPEILSVEMTRILEADLEAIMAGEVSGESVVNKAVERLEPLLLRFKEEESSIGQEIVETLPAK